MRFKVGPFSWLERNPKSFLFLTLGWAALVFAHYFSLHSFFDFSFLKTLRQDAGHSNFSRAWDNLEKVLPIGIWNFAVLVSIWAWGRKICLWIGFPRISTAIDLAFQMAFGIILFNSLWLGLGLNGLWMTPIFLIVSSLLMGPALWDGLRLSRQRKKPKWPKAPVLWLAAPLGLAALILFLALGQSLIPEVYFDGLVYHLSVLKFWQDRHGIVDFATHFESYYPFGAELYFLNGLWPFGGTDGDGAKLLNVAALGLTLLAAGGWVAEEAGAALGCLTGAAVLFLPWVSSTVWTTQNEVVLAFFLLLFFYALRRWTQGMTFSTRLPWALAVGLLGGAALTVKYTAIPAFAAALVALFFENPKSFNRDRWKEWALIKVMWLAALGPWLLKNFIYTGNPIYPYLSQILGGRHLPPLRFRELMENHESAFGTGMPFWKWPYELLAHHLDKTMGPLLFIFIPFGLVGWSLWKKERYGLVLTALYLAFGFLVSFQTRLMIPEMIFFLVTAGCFLGKLEKPRLVKVWAFLIFVFGIAGFLSLARLSTDYVQSQKVWWGAQSREAFLENCPQTASFYPLAEACDSLPAADRLLVVGDARGFYYPRPYWTNSVFDAPELTRIVRGASDAEAVREALRRLGVEDLVFSGIEKSRLAEIYAPDYALTLAQLKILNAFIERGTRLVYQKGPCAIYRLRPALSSKADGFPDLLLPSLPTGYPS